MSQDVGEWTSSARDIIKNRYLYSALVMRQKSISVKEFRQFEMESLSFQIARVCARFRALIDKIASL